MAPTSSKYQVIARKFRPQAFRDVVGQEAAVLTLKNAIRFDKVAHAYLFCGSRGVGKTTLARLFAKALNCHCPNGELEPCNQCPSCLEIASGQSLDVIEIDGASNRGIDDIRQINETVGYAPSHGKYKIYIIDEVHMLTKEAFNALLKTLEEPPEQAKFFFATTEPHKVLPTIISRCQRFDLARIQPSLIFGKLQQIAKDLNRNVEEEALHLIAAFAEGSLRDAESLLDQILCFANDLVTASSVRQSLGLAPEELFLSLDQAFSECRLSYAFELVDELFKTGKDLSHFFEQLIEHYRHLTLCRTLGEKALAPELSGRYLASARLYTQAQSLFILDLLIHAEAQFQKSSFQRIALESILLQIIRSKNRVPPEVLVKRLSQLEQALSSPQSPLPESTELLSAPQTPPEKTQAQIEKPDPAPEKASLPFMEMKKPEPIPLSRPAVEIKQEEAKKTEIPKPSPVSEPLPVSLELKPVPFNPFKIPAETPLPEKKILSETLPPPLTKPAEPTPLQTRLTSTNVHPSRYETLLRFSAVELEGTVKTN